MAPAHQASATLQTPRATERGPALPLDGPRPAEVVAARVRSVLQDHRSTEAWKGLAGALPEMALSGGADLAGTFEAARLADSISALEVSPRALRSLWAPAGLGSGRRGGVEWAQALGAGVLAGTLVVALATLARSRKGRTGRRSQRADGKGRVWAAQSLASSGIPVVEIARRTGMAQDGITVLLGLSRARNARQIASRALRRPAPPTGVRRGNSARRLDAERERLRAEIASGARRLRDGRLTYGGGR